MSETTEEFLKRMDNTPPEQWHWGSGDCNRLLALATRGAKVPDEPTEAMHKAGADYALRPTHVWCAMIQTALAKDTDNG